MRMHAFAISALIVAGCGGNGSNTVTPASTPPSDSGGGGGAGMPGGGGGGGMPGGGGGGGMPGGGGGGGGMPGGGGGMPGGGGGGAGGGGGGGTACTDTTPVAITTVGHEAWGIAIDDSDVYFTAIGPSKSTASVWRAPLAGGTAVEVGDPDEYVLQIAVNATAFFSTDDAGHVYRWSKSGGSPLQLRAATNAAIGRSCFADAFGYMYWCSSNGTNSVLVERTPEDGGGPITAVASAAGLNSIAFDPQHLWYNSNNAVVAVAPDGSGPSMTIPWSGSTLGALAVDDTHVYVGTQAGYVMYADKSPPSVLRYFAQTAGLPAEIRTDSGNVYVQVDGGDVRDRYTTIMRYAASGSGYPVDGTGATMLVGMAGTIGRFAIRGPYLYFAHVDTSTVYRVCK